MTPDTRAESRGEGVETDAGKSSELGDSRRGSRGPVGERTGLGAKAGWCAADTDGYQPGQHVDPRGVDHRGTWPDDGRLQQSGHVRPARAAEQPRIHRARSRGELVVERGR